MKGNERYLPQELVSHVLLRIPAQGLHNVMRRVCREWNLIIRTPSFVYDHLRSSTGGILIEGFLFEERVARILFYMEMRGGSVEISELDCGSEGRLLSCFNGLVLTSGSRELDTLYVVNPLTKQRVTLPPYDRQKAIFEDFGLAFVEASMEYKVVRSQEGGPYSWKMRIAVLTLGADRVWRDICVEHLTRATRAALSKTVVTGGFMH